MFGMSERGIHWLSTTDIAERAHVDRKTAARWIDEGLMENISLGKHRRVRRSDFESFQENRRRRIRELRARYETEELVRAKRERE